jgi:hypothetical protein
MFDPRSRFLPDDILTLFTRTTAPTPRAAADMPAPQAVVSVDVRARLRDIWGLLIVREAVESNLLLHISGFFGVLISTRIAGLAGIAHQVRANPMTPMTPI